MKKLLFLLLSLASIIAADELQSVSPTLEEISTSKIVEITIKCLPEGSDFNAKAWQEIIVNVNDLINKCFASDKDEVTSEEVFAELHKTIDFIRERTDANQGIRGILEIHLGQPPAENENTSDSKL